MEAHGDRKRPMFNQREIVCGVMACLFYASSLGCFYGHAHRKNLAWKLEVGVGIYVLAILFASLIVLQKLGFIAKLRVGVGVETGRMCNLAGPILGIWVLPLLEGEYADLALLAAVFGAAAFGNMMMFIAPITTDFGLLNLLCGCAVKLSWKADTLVWVRTGSSCTMIILVRYLVDRKARMEINNNVRGDLRF